MILVFRWVVGLFTGWCEFVFSWKQNSMCVCIKGTTVERLSMTFMGHVLERYNEYPSILRKIINVVNLACFGMSKNILQKTEITSCLDWVRDIDKWTYCGDGEIGAWCVAQSHTTLHFTVVVNVKQEHTKASLGNRIVWCTFLCQISTSTQTTAQW